MTFRLLFYMAIIIIHFSLALSRAHRRLSRAGGSRGRGRLYVPHPPEHRCRCALAPQRNKVPHEMKASPARLGSVSPSSLSSLTPSSARSGSLKQFYELVAGKATPSSSSTSLRSHDVDAAAPAASMFNIIYGAYVSCGISKVRYSGTVKDRVRVAGDKMCDKRQQQQQRQQQGRERRHCM